MPQKNIWNYYSICKKKLESLHARKLKRSNRNRNVENRSSSSGAVSNEINNNPTRESKKANINRNSNLIRQSKLGIDSNTRQIILKSNTIIDQTKSPIDNQNYCPTLIDDLIFKKPCSPAPKAKRRIDHQKSLSDSKIRLPNETKRLGCSILLESQRTIQNCTDSFVNTNSNSTLSAEEINKTNECKVRKRLFESNNFEDMKDKLVSNSTDKFLNKLKDFQEKTSVSNRFNVSFYSPSKRFKEQQEETAAKVRDLTSYSPQKYLENRLKNGSPKAASIKSSNLFVTENCSSPQKTSTYLSPLKSSANNSPLKSNISSSNLCSPFKTPASPFKSPMKSPAKQRFSNELTLPDKYLELTKAFYSLDTIMIYLSKHSKIGTFDKVKIGVQKVLKKDFDLKQLAQILTIYPDAFQLSYDLITDSDYRLVIQTNVQVADDQVKCKLQERLNQFRSNLIKFVKRAHESFLLSLDKPIILKNQHLKRWHPSFQFPDIPEFTLPTSPTAMSAKENLPSDENDDIEVVFDEIDEQ